MKTAIKIASFVLLVSCGGGGGGGSNFAGTYKGDLFLNKNTCGFAETDIKGLSLLVNQSENSVAVQSTKRPTINFIGSTTQNDSFSVNRTYSLSCTRAGSSAQVVEKIDFISSSDGADLVLTTSYGQCSGGNSEPACETIHQGFFVKE